jgi:hypothetical protein
LRNTQKSRTDLRNATEKIRAMWIGHTLRVNGSVKNRINGKLKAHVREEGQGINTHGTKIGESAQQEIPGCKPTNISEGTFEASVNQSKD